jgi:hypothetical protein
MDHNRDDQRDDSETTTSVDRKVNGESPDDERFDAMDELAAMAPGDMVMVYRQSPAYAKGLCEHMIVPHEGSGEDLLDQIRANWGGGTFTVQAKQRHPGGGMRFAKRSKTFVIAGHPKYQGREYVNGALPPTPTPSAPTAQTPVIVQAPQNNPGNDMQGQLLALVAKALGSVGQEGAANLDVVGLIGALQGVLGQPEKRDSFGDLERSLGLVRNLQKTFNPGVPAQDDDESPFSGMFGGTGGGKFNPMDILAMMMMKKMMGPEMSGMFGGQPQASQPPQQTMGATAPAQTQQFGPVGQPPSPDHVWHQQRGWITSEVPIQNPQPENVPQPPTTTSEPTPEPEDEEIEPITVPELLQELSEKKPEEREAFVTEFCQQIGLDQKIFQGLLPNGMPPNGPT